MRTLKEIFEYNDEGKLVLPDFQRALEWKLDDQKKLLASFLVNLPIGSLLLLKGSNNDFAAKKLCFPNDVIDPKEECYYLLDGQQRISSLKSIFSDFFKEQTTWETAWQSIYSDLRTRWFLRVKPIKESEEDLFGWNDLQFKSLKAYEPGQIIDRVEVKRIFKTKTEEWFHPAFQPKDLNGEMLNPNRRKNQIAKSAAELGIVPLYSIYDSTINDEKSLHSYVLEKIAEDRANELKVEVADGKRNIVGILELIEPDITEAVENRDEDKIRSAWSKLCAKWSESVLNYLNGIMQQNIPDIELPSNEISRAVSIFENINRGGTPLDTYDLIVAKAARNRELPSLTKRIIEILKTSIALSDAIKSTLIEPIPNTWHCEVFGAVEDNTMSKVIKNQYLNLLSIFSYFPDGNIDELKVEHLKRNKILDLSHENINDNTENVVKSLIRACAFLQYRCGLIKSVNLSYELMILPIAFALRNDGVWQDSRKINKVEYWYWSSLFSGAYREHQNEQCIRDIKSLNAWLNGGDNVFKTRFDNILNDAGYSNEQVLLMDDPEHDVPSSIHVGILQYIISKQAKDFLPNGHDLRLNSWDIAQKAEFQHNEYTYCLDVEDHHIFPLYDAVKIGESTKDIRNDKKHVLNSPLNRTYISSVANSIIREKSPSEYLQYVSQSSQWGHCIPLSFAIEYIKQNTETDIAAYKRILKKRYEELLRDIKTELERYE